jgi:hypothetical protein
MNKKVLKYTLEITDVQTITLPANSMILSVITQNDQLVVYALVNEIVARRQDFMFYTIGTGNPIPANFSAEFLQTVQHGPFVWHIFYQAGGII